MNSWLCEADPLTLNRRDITLLEEIDCTAEMPLRLTANERHYQVGLSYCENPCCSCGTVGLVCLPNEVEVSTDKPAELFFQVDVNSKALLPPDESMPHDCQDLGQEVVPQLTPQEWKLLSDYHGEFKRQITESTPDEAIDAYFPEESIEQDGAMVGIMEVLPHVAYRTIELDGKSYMVDELYCVRTGCNCSRVSLGLWPLEEVEAGKVTSEFPVIVLDYKAGECEVERSGCEDTEFVRRLAGTIVTGHYKSWFKKRHTRMKTLYKQHLQRHTESATVINDDKIGRNDPCPCGSGKKYKKCCG